MSKNKKKLAIITVGQILCIFGFIFFGILFTITMKATYGAKEDNYIIHSGEKRIAVVDDYYYSGGSPCRYYPLYSYVDDNGVKYSGMAGLGVEYTERDVKKHYGKKVEIIIDGKGGSVLSTYKEQSLAGYVIADVALGLIVIAMIILFVLETTKRAKKVKRYRDLFSKQKPSAP